MKRIATIVALALAAAVAIVAHAQEAPRPAAAAPPEDPAAAALLAEVRDRMLDRPFHAVGVLTVRRAKFERELVLRLFVRDATTSVARIEGPPREDGTAALRRDGRVFLWLPKADLLLDLPPTMGTDRLFGSDFAMDDLLALGGGGPGFAASFGADLDVEGAPCRRVLLLPRRSASALWGRIDVILTKDAPAPRRMEFRNARGDLVRTVDMAGATAASPLPLLWRAQTLRPRPSESELEIRFAERDPHVPDSFYTPAGLKEPR